MRSTRIVTVLVLLASLMGSPAGAGGLHDIVYVSTATGAPGSEFFVSEASGSGNVTIKRCCHGTNTSSVDVATVGGTATAGDDYTPTSRTVTFTTATGEGDLEFPVVDDLVQEPLETVDVELSNASPGMTIAAGGRGTVTIIDNDGPARISFARSSYSLFENFGFVELVVVRSGDISAASSVTYQTSDGSALAGQDYTSATGTIQFDVGQRIKRFDVEVTNDSAEEGSEQLTVQLTAPSGAVIDEASYPTTTITIEDDESPASDTTPPVSYFHQPLNDVTYRAREMRDILAFADDFGVGVKKVQIALQLKKTGGGCRWFSKGEKAFVAGRCAEKRWMSFSTTETVVYTLPRLLRASRGTNIRYYKAWSRGIDELGNVETSFEANRNLVRFEIR